MYAQLTPFNQLWSSKFNPRIHYWVNDQNLDVSLYPVSICHTAGCTMCLKKYSALCWGWCLEECWLFEQNLDSQMETIFRCEWIQNTTITMIVGEILFFFFSLSVGFVGNWESVDHHQTLFIISVSVFVGGFIQILVCWNKAWQNKKSNWLNKIWFIGLRQQVKVSEPWVRTVFLKWEMNRFLSKP